MGHLRLTCSWEQRRYHHRGESRIKRYFMRYLKNPDSRWVIDRKQDYENKSFKINESKLARRNPRKLSNRLNDDSLCNYILGIYSLIEF